MRDPDDQGASAGGPAFQLLRRKPGRTACDFEPVRAQLQHLRQAGGAA